MTPARRKHQHEIDAEKRRQSGATAIEYGLIASLIAVAIIAAVELVGTNLTTTFNTVAAKI